MTAAQPQSIADPLLDRLESLFRLDRPVTIFDIAPVEKSAEQLRKADPAAACLVKAGVAALKWDIDGVKRETDNANRLDPNSATLLMNSALSFKLINNLVAAENYAQLALLCATNDIQIVKEAIDCCLAVGSIKQALRIIKTREHMHLDVKQLADSINDLVISMEHIGVSEEQLKTEISIALELLTLKKIRFKKVTVEKIIFYDDGESQITAVIQFVGNFQTEMELESAFAERLIDLPNWDLSKLNTEFRHVDSYELQAA